MESPPEIHTCTCERLVIVIVTTQSATERRLVAVSQSFGTRCTRWIHTVLGTSCWLWATVFALFALHTLHFALCTLHFALGFYSCSPLASIRHFPHTSKISLTSLPNPSSSILHLGFQPKSLLARVARQRDVVLFAQPGARVSPAGTCRMSVVRTRFLSERREARVRA
jgi:hypothetical protein